MIFKVSTVLFVWFVAAMYCLSLMILFAVYRDTFCLSLKRAPDSPVYPQSEQHDPGESKEGNLLSVKKPTVGRTHSLPNDSYMFVPPQNCDHVAQAQLIAQTKGPQHILGTHSSQSGNHKQNEMKHHWEEKLLCVPLVRLLHCCICAGSRGSVHSQPEEFAHQLTVPTDLFRPISPHSHSDLENIPRLQPPRHAQTFSRTLRRQVTKPHCLLVLTPVCVSCQKFTELPVLSSFRWKKQSYCAI